MRKKTLNFLRVVIFSLKRGNFFDEIRFVGKLFLVCLINQLIAEEYEERFETIYREKLWGTNEEGEGFSGGGSILEAALPYYEYIKDFIRNNNIKSVVDLGCGDWTLSKHMDWTGIDYVGYDVVKSVIEKNIKNYASDNIRFVNANFLNVEIPSADLMICKHVLQHIPNRDVFIFLNLLSKFKHCLILDAMPIAGENVDHTLLMDFPFWDDRGVDITLPPFNVEGKRVLSYKQDVNASGMDILTHVNNTKNN
jgi:SAM-dependent methyltransferase